MFTVLWGQEALDKLPRLWTQSDSPIRAAITAAMHQIDKTLAADPENTGESRSGEDRVWFAFPLGILFEVDRPKMAVRILQVWLFRKRK